MRGSLWQTIPVMKKWFFLLVVVSSLGLVHRSKAVVLHTPEPPYPYAATHAHIQGSGVCQVTFDGSGHASTAKMSKSTGSEMLDKNTVDFAQKQWTGKPNSKASVPVAYILPADPRNPGSRVRVHTPRPPYPYQARAKREQGRGVVKVTFDEKGNAVSATMDQSTGSRILDENTVAYALKTWTSTGGEKTTMRLPINYQLR